MPDDIPLIYIGGCGRSGSTLLLRTLGRTDSIMPMGEVRRMWKVDPHENLCGCGDPYASCPIWKDMVRKHSLTENREMRSLQKRIERRRNLPQFHGWPFGTCSEEELQTYRSKIRTIYQHAREATGNQILVDSSKRAPYAYLLNSTEGIQFHLIHLIRDPRAVANSNLRQKTNPTRKNPERTKPTTRPSRVARRWNRRNLFFEALKPFVDRSITLRYESFVKQPRKHIQNIFSEFDVDQQIDLPFTGHKKIHLTPEHILESNPMRFKTGEIKIQLDDKWKRNLDPSHRRLVTSMTAPLILRYRYPMFPN